MDLPQDRFSIKALAMPGDARAEVQSPSSRGRPRGRLFVVLMAMMLALLGVWMFLAASILVEGQRVALPASAGSVTPTPIYLFSIEGVSRPLGVAVNPAGTRIYVTQSQGDRQVAIFDAVGNPAGGFNLDMAGEPASPLYVAVAPDGRVYVTDTDHSGLHIFSAEGEYLGEFLPQAGELADWAPLGVGFDPAGELLVTDATRGRHRVLVFDRGGSLVKELGTQGSAPGEFQYPNAAAAGDNGLIYVSDSNNGRVQVLDPSGRLAGAVAVSGQAGKAGLPRGLVLDYNGHLFVADTANNAVLIYRCTGDNLTYVSEISGDRTAGAGFDYPNGLTFDREGRLFVTDRGNSRVVVFKVAR